MCDLLEYVEPSVKADDDIYVLVVYGFAPEFYDGIAFRKDKAYKARRTKGIDCPYCGRPFDTVDSSTKVMVYRYSKNTDFNCHTFRACKSCHGMVGIRYASVPA
jgi:hypothetical protein